MTDKPILFNGPMVRAILDGRKTQTRRALMRTNLMEWDGKEMRPIPVGFAPGDRLWVRETFNQFWFSQDGDDAWPSDKLATPAEVRAIAEDGSRVSPPQTVYRESDRARKWFDDQPWRPSIHMPRWASRLTLIVEDVRVQRLQDISEADALAEGAPVAVDQWSADGSGNACLTDKTWRRVSPARWFHDLWNSINGPEAWAANPWVAAITFRTIRANIDSPEPTA